MTGRQCAAAGVWHTILGRSQMWGEEITMAEIFKANGYATGLFGKWHLGDNYPFRPADQGFEQVVWAPGGGVGQQPDYWGNRHTGGSFMVNGQPVRMVDDNDGITGAYSTNFFFNRAMEFMQININQQKPFFAYIPSPAAHDPQIMPPDAANGVTALQGTIENIDKNVGNLLNFLNSQGAANNTLLIFLTDNGDASTLFRGGKSSSYEGGHRVPCFVRWPAGGLGGTGRSRNMNRLVAHYDLLPTLMDVLGLQDLPRGSGFALHGVSFANLLDTLPSNDPALFNNRTVIIDNQRLENLTKYKEVSVMKDEVNGSGTVIKKWRWQRNAATTELYDLVTDPLQTANLGGQAQYAALMTQLANSYESYWTTVSARAAEYTRIKIGHYAEPVSCLNSQDTHVDGAWNQQQVAQGANLGSFIAVEFTKPGTYHFDLRRWPKEIESQTTLTTAPTGGVYTQAGVTPVSFPVASARLQVYNGTTVYFDQTLNAAANSDGVQFTVNSLPAGPAFVRTDFFNSAGTTLFRAFNTYVQPDIIDPVPISRHPREIPGVQLEAHNILNLTQFGSHSVQIFNLAGKKIVEKKLLGANKYSLSNLNLIGLYILKVYSPQGSFQEMVLLD